MQYISLHTNALEPEWLLQSLTHGEDQQVEPGVAPATKVSEHGRWGYELRVVYHGTYPSMLPNIIRDGLGRSFGAGPDALRAVCGIHVGGVYTTDRLDTAYSYPQTRGCGGPNRKRGLGGELFAADGTLPYRCVLRLVANDNGLLWRNEEKRNRQFLYRPDALHITHIYLIAHHPWNVEVDTQWSCWRDLPFAKAPSPRPDRPQGVLRNYTTWSSKPDEFEFFTDVDDKNEEEHPRIARGLTSITRRFPGAPVEASRPILEPLPNFPSEVGFYQAKMMLIHRLEKRNNLIWVGWGMLSRELEHFETTVFHAFQPEARNAAVRMHGQLMQGKHLRRVEGGAATTAQLLGNAGRAHDE